MSDSEKQIANASLKFVIESCNSALAALAQPPESPNNPLELSVIHQDMLSLLELIYAATTKVTLILKPPSPTYKASIAPLKELSEKVSAILHCTNLLSSSLHGATLKQETVSAVKDVIESLVGLLSMYSELNNHGQDEYLIRTGTVHDVINKARGLPADNVSAVRKLWERDTEYVDDALREVTEMIDDRGLEEDGWGELGFDANQGMNATEIRRATQVRDILRLSSSLRKRIHQEILVSPLQPLSDNSRLDKLPRISSDSLSVTDDLVAAMYPPQDPATIKKEIEVYREVVLVRFKGFIDELLPLEINATTSHRRWFETCFLHISKMMAVLESVRG